MLDSITQDIQLVVNTIINYANFTLGIIGILIAIGVLNKILGGILYIFGIIPRKIYGLPGIVFSPLIHGDFTHLFFNSVPLFFLLNMLLVYGMNILIYTTIFITLVTGTFVWLFGRRSNHMGASGVIMGYFGFLVVNAVLAPNFLSLMLIVLTLYYFGGLVSSLIPTESEGISVESHIFGFLSGIAAFYCLPYANYVLQAIA